MTPVFLSPGAIYTSAEPAVISTVLGSCVAVCLWDRQQAIGGMNHFLLPRSNGERSARYGDIAITLLLEEMAALGCRPADLRAKLFGGAAVLPFGAQSDTVGAQNVSAALTILRRRNVPVVARRTGGQSGLFIRFNTLLGRVMVRELAAPSVQNRKLSASDSPAAMSAASGKATIPACTARSRAMV